MKASDQLSVIDRRTLFPRILGLLVFFGFSLPFPMFGWDVSGPVRAASFGMNFLKSKKVEADPEKMYQLTDNEGPWMILAYAFSGDQAEEKANELVLELRRRYKLEAYVFEKRFDFNVGEGMRDTERAQLRRKQYLKSTAKEYAVLVGNYVSTEDEDYKKTLKIVKNASPETLKTVNFNGVVLGNSSKRPMAMAMATPNPALPEEFFNNKGVVDEFVAKLNSKNPYSILNCKARYTLRVATFTGNMTIKQDEVEKIAGGRADFKNKDQLYEAAACAAKLCEALRKKGFQAYVFHDRYSSIVTVGGFNEIGTTGPDGTMEMLPEIVRLRDLFIAEPAPATKPGELPYKPRSLLQIPFDVEPKLIPVPKRSFHSVKR